MNYLVIWKLLPAPPTMSRRRRLNDAELIEWPVRPSRPELYNQVAPPASPDRVTSSIDTTPNR